jgi:hypothetical protein
MITFVKTVHIDRPKQEVFDFVSNPANDAQWRKGSRGAQWSSEPPYGLGSTFGSTDRSMGRDVPVMSEITVWDPPDRYAFRSLSSAFPAEFELAFEAEGGGTRLTSRGAIEFTGWLRWLEWLFGRQVKRQVEGDFDRLKALLEKT